MKVSVPSSYARKEPTRVLELGSSEALAPEPSREPDPGPEPGPEERPPLPVLSADWWQSFLYGNADALLDSKDAQRALELIAGKLGKEAGQLGINGNIRSSELRKKLYATFGADLVLYTMQVLWLEASSNGEPLTMPTVPPMPEAVARF